MRKDQLEHMDSKLVAFSVQSLGLILQRSYKDVSFLIGAQNKSDDFAMPSRDNTEQLNNSLCLLHTGDR